MTADWVVPLPEKGVSGGKHPASTPDWMATGRVDLTGAALHSPRTTAFAYSPGLPTQQRWRISIDGQPLWVQDPSGVLTDFGGGLPRRVRPEEGAVVRQPAPEVVSLCCLETAALGWLDVPMPFGPSGPATFAGRPALVYETDSPRRCLFVVDEETEFVLSVAADGIRGPLSVVVSDFAVEPLDVDVFRYIGPVRP